MVNTLILDAIADDRQAGGQVQCSGRARAGPNGAAERLTRVDTLALRPNDEDRDWDWWSIYLDCTMFPTRYECYAALARNELHGLMVLDLKKQRIGGGHGIGVDYLSTNPENRGVGRGLKHIGTALIGAAISRSFDRGGHGRIWLESLPGAELFYASLGMTKQHRRTREGNLVFILDSVPAKQLLDEIIEKGIVRP